MMWEDRGHAKRIRAAAKTAGLRCTVVLGFTLVFEGTKGTMLKCRFSTNGTLARSSVRAQVTPMHAFAETYLTTAEATRAIVAWLDVGMPTEFDVLSHALPGWKP